MTPLSALRRLLPRPLPSRLAWRPVAVLAVSFALTALATHITSLAVRATDRVRFQSTAEHLQAVARERLEAYTTVLDAGSALVGTRPKLTHSEFQRFVSSLRLEHRYPGILGVGYSMRLQPGALDSLVAARRADGDPGFHVWPDGPRDEYHTIVYLQPLNRRNRAAIGYDMFTNATRRRAMERARDTGLSAASGRVTLVQEIDAHKQPGFLIYVPVYAGGVTPATVAARRDALRGFVYAPFRAGDLFHALFHASAAGSDAGGPPEQVAVRIYSAPVPDTGALLYDSHEGAAPPDAPGAFDVELPLPVARRRWTIAVTALPAFFDSGDASIVHVVLIGGLAATIVLFLVTASEARALARTERARCELQRSEQALRESESRYRQLVEHASDGLMVVGPDDEIDMANTALHRALGYEQQELVGREVASLFADGEVTCLLRGEPGAPANGDPVIAERMLRRADGAELPVEIGVTRLGGGHVEAIVRDISARRAAERELRVSEERFRSLFQNHPDAVFSVDREGIFLGANLAAEVLTGRTPEEMQGRSFAMVVAPDELEGARSHFARAIGGIPQHYRCSVIHATGRRIQVDVTNIPVRVDGEIVGVFGIARDITEQARLEAELRQAQKMEAVGQLAGGVAHDFNNLLTAIKCNTGFLREGCPECGTRLEEVEEIDRAADRATSLTGQLLAFSRRQVIRPREVDVDALLAGLERMLARLVPESIQQELTLGANRAHVRIDPGQLEQVVLNLVVNARDAMAGEGKLVLRTRRAALASTDARRFGGAAVVPGAYAHISVRDSGCGMDAATLARVFEPFFTTKPAGVGTGLGLSTVYGIVKQNRGYVSIASVPGAGTTVDVYLPLVLAPAAAAQPEPEQRPAAGGTETILLVEDEPAIRAVATRALAARGYTVLAAADGAQALGIAEAHGRDIDLLVTDVVMPAMSGRELAERLCEGRARIPVLFMSGYSDSNVHAGALAPGTNLLNKPFTPRELLERVRGALDGSGDGWG